MRIFYFQHFYVIILDLGKLLSVCRVLTSSSSWWLQNPSGLTKDIYPPTFRKRAIMNSLCHFEMYISFKSLLPILQPRLSFSKNWEPCLWNSSIPKSFWTAKETINKIKGETMEWDKICNKQCNQQGLNLHNIQTVHATQ